MGVDDDATGRRFGPAGHELGAFLELLALTGVAVAQPVLDIVSKDTTMFLTRRAGPAEIVAYTILLVLTPPVVLWCAEVLVGLVRPGLRRWAHLLWIFALTTLIADEVVKKTTSWQWRPIVVVAVLVGAAATILLARVDALRVWLRFLAAAPAVFVAVFLFSSPVSALVLHNGSGSASGAHVGRPGRVVMIVFDEFPLESLLDGTGHVDAEMFPHFARLAEASTWYRNDGTVAPFTAAAVPAILTGRYPKGALTPPVAAAYPQSLFTLLGGTYRMNVHESVTQLCPSGICAGATPLGGTQGGSGFGGLMHQSYDLWRDFWAPGRRTARDPFVEGDTTRVADIGRDFVASIRRDSKPRLDFLHVLLPHEPWHLLGSEQDYLTQGHPGLFAYTWVDQWAATSAHQRHLLQLQAADTLLGQVVAKLQAIGAWNDSTLVVTADHGAAFTGKQPFRGVSAENYPQIVWTPLFVKTPGQSRGVADDRFARSIDVLPTIADILDVKLPWRVDGSSLLGPPAREGPRRVFDWNYNALRPPPGSRYVTVDGPAGFAKVLTARAVDPVGDPKLRLYRAGPYGGLVGTRAADLPHDATNAPGGSIDDPGNYDDVVPEREDVPWVWISGRLDATPAGRYLAVTVDGVVAGISQTEVADGKTEFWTVLAPQLFHPGRNDIGVALIGGTPLAPRLQPVQLR